MKITKIFYLESFELRIWYKAKEHHQIMNDYVMVLQAVYVSVIHIFCAFCTHCIYMIVCMYYFYRMYVPSNYMYQRMIYLSIFVKIIHFTFLLMF